MSGIIARRLKKRDEENKNVDLNREIKMGSFRSLTEILQRSNSTRSKKMESNSECWDDGETTSTTKNDGYNDFDDNGRGKGDYNRRERRDGRNNNFRSGSYDNDKEGNGDDDRENHGYDENNEDDDNRRGGRDGGRGRGRGRGGSRGGRGGRDGFSGRDRNHNNDDNENEEEGGGGGDGEAQEKPREFYIPPELSEDPDELFNSGISTGINFQKYEKINVKVSGDDVPNSINFFNEAGFRDHIMHNIKRSHYTIPTPIQKAAIPAIMAGRDLMGCAQTGSGKTAAYLLPIINKLLEEGRECSIGQPQAVILAPTRELAIQICQEAKKFALDSCLKVSLVYGGTSTRYQSEVIQKGCHILIATVGRLLDFVNKTFITFESVRFIVLDEADRMLDMGFKPSIDEIMNNPVIPDATQRTTLMFSATFPEEIQQMAFHYMKPNYVFVTVGILGGACDDVEQNFIQVTKFEKRDKLKEMLRETTDGTIVFVGTKRTADFLASILSEMQLPATSIHGDRLQRQREEALRDFKSGKMHILIATAVAARGLDIKNVKHVINYDLPESIDEYVHRIGRTGRVGNRGKATSFFDPESNSALAPSLVKILKDAKQDVPDFLEMLAGGGSASYTRDDFGGDDIRQKQHSDIPQSIESEEAWD